MSHKAERCRYDGCPSRDECGRYTSRGKRPDEDTYSEKLKVYQVLMEGRCDEFVPLVEENVVRKW